MAQSGAIGLHEDTIHRFKTLCKESDERTKSTGVDMSSSSPIKAKMEAKPLFSPDRLRFVPPVVSTARKAKV